MFGVEVASEIETAIGIARLGPRASLSLSWPIPRETEVASELEVRSGVEVCFGVELGSETAIGIANMPPRGPEETSW